MLRGFVSERHLVWVDKITAAAAGAREAPEAASGGDGEAGENSWYLQDPDNVSRKLTRKREMDQSDPNKANGTIRTQSWLCDNLGRDSKLQRPTLKHFTQNIPVVFCFFFLNSGCFGPFELWPGARRPAWKPQAAFATHNSARVVPLRERKHD